MNLAPHRFSETTLFKTPEGEDITIPNGGMKWDVFETAIKYKRYSYETANVLLDVDVRVSTGERTYQINCLACETPSAIHKAIEEHFAIGGAT